MRISVTQEVASSSLVGPAKVKPVIVCYRLFIFKAKIIEVVIYVIALRISYLYFVI